MPALNIDSYAWLIADHIEMEHEREVPGYWTYKELEKMHKAMHRKSNHWDHEHE